MTENLNLEKAVDKFLDYLSGKNRSVATIRAYKSDVEQFITWIHDNNIAIKNPEDVKKTDIVDYLTYLSKQGFTGIYRARKLTAIREYFRYLEGLEFIVKSPTTGVETPKKEKKTRNFLRADEYTKILSLAGVNPRDYAILQVFLQTGVRVSEIVNLKIDDVDLISQSLKVTGKGNVQREIELEKKGIQAIKSWLIIRPQGYTDNLFLNYKGEPISERGTRKLVTKYLTQAGITKQVSCHGLRHTFASAKAEKGVSSFQLQKWLGHANLNTTQIYVHLARKNAKKVMENTSL